eukprot:134809_1
MHVFGGIGVILFFIWCVRIFMEQFLSKWNYFCANMITPKHSYFVLSQTTKNMISKCEIIYNENKKVVENKFEEQLNKNLILNEYAVEDSTSMKQFILHLVLVHVCIISFIIAIAIQHTQCTKRIYVIAAYESVIVIILSLSVVYESKYPGIVFSMSFASYISTLLILLLQRYGCQDESVYQYLIILQVIGSLLCSFMFHLKRLMWCWNKCAKTVFA